MSECLQNDRVVLIFCQQVAASVIYKNPLIVPFVQRVSIFICIALPTPVWHLIMNSQETSHLTQKVPLVRGL